MPIISATTVSTTSTFRPRIAGQLIQYISRVLGGELEPPVLASAFDCLNQAIMKFNSRLYECTRVMRYPITTTGRIGTLPTDFYKELECQLLDDKGGRIRQLSYEDFAAHEHTYNYATQLGSAPSGPFAYTIFNAYGEGKIRILPLVSPTNTDPNYLQLSYHKRLPTLIGNDDVLDAPQEIEYPILMQAQADLLRMHNPSSPALAGTMAMAAEAWQQFRIIDAKHPDMKPRFRLPSITSQGWAPQGDGVVYIKAS